MDVAAGPLVKGQYETCAQSRAVVVSYCCARTCVQEKEKKGQKVYSNTSRAVAKKPSAELISHKKERTDVNVMDRRVICEQPTKMLFHLCTRKLFDHPSDGRT